MPDLVAAPPPPSTSPNVTATPDVAGSIFVANGDTLYGVGLNRLFGYYYGNGIGVSLVNDGILWLDSNSGGLVFSAQNWGSFTNHGTAVVHSANGDADGFEFTSIFNGPLINSGSIYAISDAQNAHALQLWFPALVDNSGTIAARGGNYAEAIYAPNGTQIVNHASGEILAEGAHAIAISFVGAQFTPAVQNYGLIEAQSTDPNNASVAISVTGGETIENYGTISADIAINSNPYWFTPPPHLTDEIDNFAGGTINGAIFLDLGDDHVVNQGQINGYVDMGEDDDLFDNSLGQHNGTTDLGWGDDAYIGGSGTDAVAGNRGDDSLTGGGGNDLLLGGWGNDTIRGDAGNDGIYGEGGNDTITTRDGDYVDAGDGDDRVVLGDYAFAKVLGGSGHDVLVLPTDSRILTLSLVASSARVSGFEEINLAAGDHIVVHPSDIAALAGGTTLTISAQGNGIVDLAGSWVAGSTQIVGGMSYTSYSSAGSQLLVAQSLAVNLGTDPAGATGLDAAASGPAAPLPGSVPGADLTSNEVDGGIALSSNFEIFETEHWTSTIPAPVIGVADGAMPSFTNRGTLDASNAEGARGISAMYFDDLVNYGTVTATALSGTAQLAANESYFNTYGIYNSANLQGNAFAVYVGSGADNFQNFGTIHAETSQTVAFGYLTWGNWPGENQGTIEALSSDFVAIGAYAHNGGIFTNSGTITATGGWRAYGVASYTWALQLNNSGSITAHTTDAGSEGIAVYGGGHITNAGTITGEIAIESDSPVWVDNGGQINGRIELAPNSTVHDDVIINSGVIHGNISLGAGRDVYDGGLGTQVGTIFGQDGNDLLIGASATLDGGAGNDVLVSRGGSTLTGGAGADTFVFTTVAPSLTETISDFTSGSDRIDLRALAPTSVSISGSTVTAVTDSGTLTIHLNSGTATLSDIITGNSSTVTGGSGDDVLVAGPSATTLNGGDGLDLLIGGSGNDRLDGGIGNPTVGTLADIMVGGAGNDTYIIDHINDAVIENPGGGIDTIQVAQGSNLTFTMPANVENLLGGSAYGNALDNQISGSSSQDLINGGAGNDVITGLGGADSLTGGAGADRFVYASASDSTAQALDEILDFEHGLDVIDLGGITPTSISFSYGNSWGTHSATDVTIGTSSGILKIQVDGYVDHSDFLTKFQSVNGSAANDKMFAGPNGTWLEGQGGNDWLIGGTGSDTLHGGDGNDILMGGVGIDSLVGGAGADRFFAGSGGNNADRIGDYSAEDRIYLDASIFSALGLGNLPKSAFATLGNDTSSTRIIYAPALGMIMYDADGSGSGGYVLVAVVQNYAPITAASFVVYSGDPLAVQSPATYVLGADDWNLQLTGASAIDGTGNALDNVITGNGASNNLFGLNGNDDLRGGAGADTLTGGAGPDRLAGGDGSDTFRDTAAGLNGDTISDLGTGDKIVITDSALAGFTFSLAGNTLTYTGGSLTLSNFHGNLVAGAAGGGVQLTALPHHVNNDFNGDGRSDILWREDSGTITDWLGQASGGFAANWGNSFKSVTTDWHVAGTGDFNGDGRDDILWRNDNGLTVDWLGQANGGFSSNYANSAVNVPTSWAIVGIGDFNGDGREDILWRDTGSGLTVDWLGQANGSFASNWANSVVTVPADWKVAGIGDFNGDGLSDILWRNDNGLTVDWLAQANGGFSSNWNNSVASVPTDWHVAGTGDFDGDGRDDILWRSDGGMVTEWLGTASGGFSSNWGNFASGVPGDWKVAQIGDFNGDGRDDILWRNDNGQLTDWLGTSTGAFTDNYANAATFVPTNWHVQGDPFL